MPTCAAPRPWWTPRARCCSATAWPPPTSTQTGSRPCTTSRWPPEAAPRPHHNKETDMALFHYLKYFLFHAIGLMSLAFILAGGAWVTRSEEHTSELQSQ